MISGRQVASEVLKRAFDLSSGLDGSVATVLASCPEEEGREYRRAVGHVMAEVYGRILMPFLRTHPDLTPEGWRD